MKGVKINNYIDNRIVLSGRKMKNEMQTLIQAHRPRPIVIRHLNYVEAEDQEANDMQFHAQDKDVLKPIEHKSEKKKKKGNKTTTFNNIEIKQHHPSMKEDLKLKTTKQNGSKFVTDKKKSIQSSPSGKSEKQFNQTQKRIKSASKSTEGLGKRSKSTIIKRNKSPSNVGLDKVKKITESPSMRLNLDKKKQIQPSKKKNHKKDKKSTETGKQLKKNVSSLNVSQRKKRSEKQLGTKTSRPTSKSITSTAKQSKPVSARQNKQGSHVKSKHSNIATNLFTSDDRKNEKQYNALEQLLNVQQNDHKIKDAIRKLQQAINSGGSRKKISQKLQFLAERLKQMDDDQQQQQEQSNDQIKNNFIRKQRLQHHQNQSYNKRRKINQLSQKIQINQNGSDQKDKQKQTNLFNIKHKVQDQKQQKQKQDVLKGFQNPDKAKAFFKNRIDGNLVSTDKMTQQKNYVKQQIKQAEQIQESQQLPWSRKQQKLQIVQVYQKQKENQQEMKKGNKNIDLFAQLFGVNRSQYHEEQNESQKQSKKAELKGREEQVVKQTSQLNIQYRVVQGFEDKRIKQKQESVTFRETLEHENGIYDQHENPLIDRRPGDAYLNIAEYDSINSVASSTSAINKQKEISQLKKFQQQSNKMMDKIKQLELKKKQADLQQPSLHKSNSLNANTNTNTNSNDKKIQISPKNSDTKNYGFDKYPSLQNIKSPKYISQQILSAIKLKERVQKDRHEKLSQLVSVMYTKQLVSPRTYSIQVQSLRQQHEHNNQMIDSYKKHAQELAKILSQIKKQKQEINSIDDMIRTQKWDQAMDVIKQTQNSAKKIQLKNQKQQQKVAEDEEGLFQKVNSSQSEEDQQVIYYEGEKSEVEESQLKLHKVQLEESHSFHEDAQSQNTKNKDIVIDEDNAPKKQRGFDSNLFFIKQYCIALCQYVRDNYRQNFRERIGQPKSYDLIKLLRSFRTSEGVPSKMRNSQYQQLDYYGCEHHNNLDPVSKQIFDEFNRKYENIKFFGKESTELAALQQVFLTSIFDALNESIGMQKPAGTFGQSLPWANDSRNLKNLKNSTERGNTQRKEQSQDFIFGAAIARIIHWGSNLCGFIADTVDLENTEIDEQYVAHIRETRLEMLLQKMVQNQELEITQYQLEDTQVLLSISELVQTALIDQFHKQMNSITLKALIKGFQL